MSSPLRVTVWNEFRHEQHNPVIKKIYPRGIHGAIAKYLKGQEYKVSTATLDQPEHGLTDKLLQNTDVLIWWSHIANHEVSDTVTERIQKRVLDGMGLIVLHSGLTSNIFKRLLGTTCDIKWREADETERLWVVQPGHPIVEGLGEYIELEREEMYGEFFDIPQPDELIFVSWFTGGEVFRSGCTFIRGRGKIFYFRPGHETYPTYHNEQVLKVISNAVRWAAPVNGPQPVYGNAKPLENIVVK